MRLIEAYEKKYTESIKGIIGKIGSTVKDKLTQIRNNARDKHEKLINDSADIIRKNKEEDLKDALAGFDYQKEMYNNHYRSSPPANMINQWRRELKSIMDVGHHWSDSYDTPEPFGADFYADKHWAWTYNTKEGKDWKQRAAK